MTQANTLSIDDLIRELDVGRATVKFILKRFSPWLPFDRINGNHLYAPSAIPVLIRIRDLLEAGTLPSGIEEILDTEDLDPAGNASEAAIQAPPEKDVRMSADALGFIQDLFQDIKTHQNRIAKAHEQRAEAEQRKAVAIEKRAEAEEKKADAMNNIAAALQEMNRQRAADNEAMEIAGQAARALTMNDVDPGEDSLAPTGPPTDVETDDFEINGIDLEDVFDHTNLRDTGISPEDIAPENLDDGDADDSLLETDDLSLLVEDDTSPGELDDLSALIDTVSDADATPESNDDIEEIENLLDGDIDDLPEPDDLSALVDDAPHKETIAANLDDLSALVDASETAPGSSEAPLDDLYSLVDTGSQDTSDMDDLSLLVEQETETPASDEQDMDNLSLLVDAGPEDTAASGTDSQPMDDLSQLVDDEESQTQSGDDLWGLVEDDDTAAPEAPAQPSLKPDITPDQDLAKYKAAVMKIIIELKSQGLSPEDTTDRLNKDEVPTLSGKPQWRAKAIKKIYGFIDSAK